MQEVRHFSFSPTVIFFSCSYTVWRSATGSETTRLVRHLKDAHKIDIKLTKSTEVQPTKEKSKIQTTLAAMPLGTGVLTPQQTTTLVVSWLAQAALPFSTVSSPILNKLLAPEVKKHLLSPRQYSRELPKVVGTVSKEIRQAIKVRNVYSYHN